MIFYYLEFKMGSSKSLTVEVNVKIDAYNEQDMSGREISKKN